MAGWHSEIAERDIQAASRALTKAISRHPVTGVLSKIMALTW